MKAKQIIFTVLIGLSTAYLYEFHLRPTLNK